MRFFSWIDNVVIALGVLVVLLLAPFAAIYQAVTGHPGAAMGCVGLFVAVLVVVLFKARDAVVSRGVRPNAGGPRHRD